MPRPRTQRSRISRLIVTTLIFIVGLLIVTYIIYAGRHYFGRRSILQAQNIINGYGVFSPLAIIALIVLSTIIPPLPIPVPLVEIAAGLIFGFWPAFFLVWSSQILSSLVAFWLTRVVGKQFFKNLLDNQIFRFYEKYINKKGPVAVFMLRSLLAAPFNMISFLAGLTQMTWLSFTVATIAGTVSESFLFTLVGSIFRYTHLRLWYLFILIVLLGAVGPVLTLLTMRFLEAREKYR